MNLKIIVVVALIALGVVMSTFTVDQREKAIMFKFGEIKRSDLGPGLHFKIPVVNNVRTFDSRILTLDAQPERFLTSEKKNVIVDFFVKWRIENVEQYFVSTRGEEISARARLSQIMKDGLRNEFGKRTIKEAVSGERDEIMEVLRVKSNKVAKELGIDIVDVRINRIDLPDEVSESVYARMRAEREQVAAEFRARGKQEAEKIRAKAQREATIVRANAYREAEKVQGEGDARAAEIYASAYGRDPEFYAFYRSIQAYTRAFSSKSDVMVLEPDAEFFRYFKKSKEN